MTRKKTTSHPARHGRKAAGAKPVRRKKSPRRIAAEVRQIVRELAAMPVLHDADPDEWLYDERGLPH
jgi:hypothetical protein